MARLEGVDLPREKRLEIALTYIYGIGRTRAAKILEGTGISGDIRVKDVTEEQLVQLRNFLDEHYRAGIAREDGMAERGLEGDLRRQVAADIRTKQEIGSYQGRRHRAGLPVRGQRTRTNARTRKGKKQTVAGKKKAR
ncbi:MAG: 30S ribosomal protein S13 [Propionibacteriaceae bacterium]|jgi:small subunit ribosomal protein S13|nr:30S ribosomal protein S13 [Propionibacteriaceae bacterium]